MRVKKNKSNFLWIFNVSVGLAWCFTVQRGPSHRGSFHSSSLLSLVLDGGHAHSIPKAEHKGIPSSHARPSCYQSSDMQLDEVTRAERKSWGALALPHAWQQRTEAVGKPGGTIGLLRWWKLWRDEEEKDFPRCWKKSGDCSKRERERVRERACSSMVWKHGRWAKKQSRKLCQFLLWRSKIMEPKI